MEKQELIKKTNLHHQKIIERIYWFYQRVNELGIKKQGDEFMMDGEKCVCLDIEYKIDYTLDCPPDVRYSIKNEDGIYTEMQYRSLYLHDCAGKNNDEKD